MWYWSDTINTEKILKITGIEAHYLKEYSFIYIFCGNTKYDIEFNNESDCIKFFAELRKNLGDPNKILQNEAIVQLS